MTIMAIMAVIGISLLVGINNNVIMDHITEGVLTQIRDAQNKALATAVDPADSTKFPVAWVVKIDKSAGTITNYYVNYTEGANPAAAETQTSIGVYSTYAYQVQDLKVDGTDPINNVVYLFYTTPFGYYYELDANGLGLPSTDPQNFCYSVSVSQICQLSFDYPKNLLLNTGSDTGEHRSGNHSVTITLTAHGVTSQIKIGPNGEAYIGG